MFVCFFPLRQNYEPLKHLIITSGQFTHSGSQIGIKIVINNVIACVQINVCYILYLYFKYSEKFAFVLVFRTLNCTVFVL